MARKLKYPARIAFLSYLGDTQGCGTIRVIYPYFLLNHYKKKDLTIHTTYFSQFVDDISFYKNQTFVQFQRSATKQHFEIFNQFKNRIQPQAKVPIVYEIDDLLINIPEWNYAAPYYKNNQPYIEKMMSMADAMIVSTPTLKKVYSKYQKKIDIIENHLPKFVWGDIYPKHEYEPREKRPRILWGGSQNHFAVKPLVDQGITGGDFGKKLLNFIKKTTDKYQWVFSGGFPHELEKVKNKLEYHGWKDVFNYPRHIKNLDVDFCMAPLMPGIFNESKSNIKQLEYVAIGCPAVYSDIAPYKKCHLRAKDDDELIAGIEKLAGDIDYRGRVWRKDYQAVRGQLWWEESGNIKKYINTYLGLFGQKL
jgi:hypothetical protein